MVFRWLPWKYVVRRFALSHGFLDPLALSARLQRFAQPSEVTEPIELLRAGVVFHARGLINSRVIQHNLDWVWPYWVERQFDPADESFTPRAFSITHVNLTHRNWTAVGLPDHPELPIVDPRGLLTPHHDGWSMDVWIVTDDGAALLPSRATDCVQDLTLDPAPVVTTTTRGDGLELVTHVSADMDSGQPRCRLTVDAMADRNAWAVIALRPYNPEGVSLVGLVDLEPDRRTWRIDGRPAVTFEDPVDSHHVSDYRGGDVFIHLRDRDEQSHGACDIGMATAAALFALKPGQRRRLSATVPMEGDPPAGGALPGWRMALEGRCRLSLPDPLFQRLHDAAVSSLILHSPEDVYPGPYTYKRFWFRDAAFLISGLLAVGLIDRAERALDRFPARQTRSGYFRSQDGEWDSNGQALWIMRRFCEDTGRPPKPDWMTAIRRGGRWITRKRVAENPPSPHAGLLPPGFSAEHLGPNDYYYWDDFWGVAGLRAAAWLCRAAGDDDHAAEFETDAASLQAAIDRSLDHAATRLGRPAMPASPYRRLDPGAIGSLAVGYPLRLVAPDDSRLCDTADFLMGSCLVRGGFFQDMIHSGINAYLTLHIAQVLLRAGDPRWFGLVQRVAELASPTGQWPEAIHPRTLGGCMGDGQHIWAAAEWILMMRHCFVREEGDGLILASGIAAEWLDGDGKAPLTYGPAPTRFGPVTVTVTATDGEVNVAWHGAWRNGAPPIDIHLPGHARVTADAKADVARFARAMAP
ncbi:MAG: hypothetical protein ACTS3R_20235 [Inquilinaceae bacterium]